MKKLITILTLSTFITVGCNMPTEPQQPNEIEEIEMMLNEVNDNDVPITLSKGDEKENYTLYASHSIWNSKEDFWNWTKSEAFKLAHKNAGQHKDLYIGAPDFEGFEKVL